MTTCWNCGGEGFIVVCIDDLCVGSGHCMHGDGEDICPECDGDGVLGGDDDYDDDWDEQDEPLLPSSGEGGSNG